MDIVQLNTRPDLLKIIKTVDPTFRRQKAILAKPSNHVRLSGTYWDGGSCSIYYQVNTATGTVTPLSSYSPPQFGGPREDPVHPLTEGLVVVEMGTFCGKPATPTIYMPAQV